jgi:hypothetical protein
LIVVTVVLLMVSLAVVGLLSMVRLDYQATKMRGRELLLENGLQIAESYIAAVARMSREQRFAAGNLTRSAELFAKQPIDWTVADEDQILFSVVLPQDLTEQEGVTFGLVNESAKLNLYQVLEWEQTTPGAGERALLQLPGMQPEQAAAIMDWIDRDSSPRLGGGEQEQYLTEQRPVVPVNEVPTALETLVHVRETHLADWFDEVEPPSLNRPVERSPSSRGGNQKAAAEPSSRSAQQPRLGQDAGTHRAWEHFLTVHSRERNESFNGQPRIYLNDEDLIRLHDALAKRVSAAMADFVVLYRQFGPGRGGRRQALADAVVDFNLPAKFKFASELDLIGATVTIPGGRTTWQRFDSPLSANRSGWAGQLEYLMDQVTVDPNPVLLGRINIDEATREVLLAIPGLEPTTADRILAARFLSADGRVAHVHPTWLLEQGVVDIPRMRQLLKYCTTGGDVFQAHVIAYIPQSSWFLREIVAIDGAEKVPVKLYCKDRRDSVIPFEME